jgi:hypothetical protein
MSVSNYDSSDVTRFRKARALYAFKAANQAAVTAGTSVLPVQGPPPLNSEQIVMGLGAGVVYRDSDALHAGCVCSVITNEGTTAPIGGT